MKLRSLAAWAVIAMAFSLSSPAQAFLGEDESALTAVKLILSAQNERITIYDTHSVHEYGIGNGIVRAYVSPQGKIFAYTGHNLRLHPDASLFGNYIKEFQSAARATRALGGRRPLSVNTSNITSGMTGPQGALHWYIYIQALPPGVTSNDIQ